MALSRHLLSHSPYSMSNIETLERAQYAEFGDTFYYRNKRKDFLQHLVDKLGTNHSSGPWAMATLESHERIHQENLVEPN
jgi:hypothetical protein